MNKTIKYISFVFCAALIIGFTCCSNSPISVVSEPTAKPTEIVNSILTPTNEIKKETSSTESLIPEPTVDLVADPIATEMPSQEPETEPVITASPTDTPVPVATDTPVPTPTDTPTPEPTATNTPTPTPTATNTPTPTPTDTPTPEPTPEPTSEPTPIAEITVENVEAPSGSFYEGKSFNIKGNLSVSIGNIVEVKGFILDINENILQESSDSPNANSYNLASSKVDKNLKFGKLAAGEYLFKVTLTPEYGKEEVIISSRFTVTANVVTGITASVSSKTRYIGDTLTADDFTVKAVMSDGSKKKVSGWTAEPLTLGSTSNTVTVYYQNFAATVTVAASEKVAVVTPEPGTITSGGTTPIRNEDAHLVDVDSEIKMTDADAIANYASSHGWSCYQWPGTAFIGYDFSKGNTSLNLIISRATVILTEGTGQFTFFPITLDDLYAILDSY